MPMPEKVRDNSAVFKAKGRWLRLYASTVHNAKAQRLEPYVFKAWINLLCIAADGDGTIRNIDRIAWSLRVSVHDLQNAVDTLVCCGLLDVVERIGNEVVLRPHDWDVWQFRGDHSAPDRMRKYRKRKQAVTGALRNAIRNRSYSVSVSDTSLEDRKTVSQEEEQDSLDSDYTREEDVA